MLAKLMTNAEVEELLRAVPGFEEGRQERAAIMFLGEQIRELRKSRLHISQKAAAKLSGIEQPELSRLEAGVGKRGPSILTITRIINAYQAYLRQTDPTIRVGLTICVSHDNSSQITLSPSEEAPACAVKAKQTASELVNPDPAIRNVPVNPAS